MMTREEAVKLLQEDLQNEVNHMMFYLYAASAVEGLHREELREFFLQEAKEELEHVHEFSDLIAYINGAAPQHDYHGVHHPLSTNPYTLLQWAVDMEQHVAGNYAKRLHQTEPPHNDPNSFSPVAYDPWIATLHVFYEDQIKHSQTTAWELKKWITRFPVKVCAAE